MALPVDGVPGRNEKSALEGMEERTCRATLSHEGRSKTDGEGQGDIDWVRPLKLVRRWCKRAGVEDAFLFRSLDKGGAAIRALPPGQVVRIFKRMARKAGLPDSVMRGLSGHSARVGAAQDIIVAGIELPATRYRPGTNALAERERRSFGSDAAPLGRNAVPKPPARSRSARRRSIAIESIEADRQAEGLGEA